MWKSYVGYVAGNSGEERVTELVRLKSRDVPLEGQFAKKSNEKIYHQRYMSNSNLYCQEITHTHVKIIQSLSLTK